MAIVASDCRKGCGALLLRCTLCFEDGLFFITREKTTSPDVCVFSMSPKWESTQSLFAGFCCPSCNNPFDPPLIDLKSYGMKTIIAVHMVCSACTERMNIVYWDPPYNYYNHAVNLGDAALLHVPEAAHVFYVAALENYLQKCFMVASDFNKFLVTSRKLGFQDLKGAKQLYDAFFGIDLSRLAGKKWSSLTEAVTTRNLIVHNAGHDKSFTPVSVTESTASQVRGTIAEFVENLLRPRIRELMID